MLALLAPYMSGDLRAQLGCAEGLAHVVIGSQAIAHDGVFLGNLGGEKDDRAVEARADPPHQVEPVELGHHHVAENKVEARKIHGKRFRWLRNAYDLVPVSPEHTLKRGKYRLLVVYSQYARHRLRTSLSVVFSP
ncbi:hypothetical protein CE91St30_14720 [Raoultibacter timonensis]|uniref:Uncharacterized protein n=1 Tax=Raoultibacter timonensis TaxID=1907662 RepID=A0ABN6MDW9_9ACTN|nr:hypothetical protein CE91St30_14720 [Raoultibacter timonensis]BDF50743.1 hypothetical protein CE91St31_14730 [Raoultibacter timonensis]